VLFLKTALGLAQALTPLTRNRPRLGGALVIQPPRRFAQPAAPALRGRQLRRQHLAARLAELGVFGGIDGVGLIENLAAICA